MANPELGTAELSTIAQLLYPDLQTLDFARIVAELDTVLLRLRGGEVEITWDCDDLVTFDVPETRILLAWTETGTRGSGGCLTVSVGPNPTRPAPPPAATTRPRARTAPGCVRPACCTARHARTC